MHKLPDPLLPLKGAQAKASQPDAHVWLSASAGTGKTHVLTARVYRLLLGGAAPESILCLTFTKAGASEMAARIHERLAAWVQMRDEALAEDLKALDEPYGPDALDRARELFARVLEATGGGLRIQTIHSFCQQILASFPMEAGLVPGFRPLEERESNEIARNALAEMVITAEASGDQALMDALHAMAVRMGEADAEAYLRSCAKSHALLDGIGNDVRGWLFDQLGLPMGNALEIVALHCTDEAFDMASIARLIRVNTEWGRPTGLKLVEKLQTWRDSPVHQRAETLDLLYDAVFTGKGTLRIPTAVQLKIDPDYNDVATLLGERVAERIQLANLIAYADFVAQALAAGRTFAQAYAQTKRANGGVDYDDLIARAAQLLETPGISEWICFKLDSQIDHILVDEAQDTNSLQWTIIKALSAEYFAGAGAKEGRARTLFVVGDFKQAIYGFQGTSPRAFAEAQRSFKRAADDAEQLFYNLSLDTSFRSTAPVLEVVDATIRQLGAEALGLEPGMVFHEAHKPFGGRVSLWKPIAAPPKEDDDVAEAIDGDEDVAVEQNRQVAEKIAGQIAYWLNSGTMLESKGRAMQAGDIMILVRSRGELSKLIIARLYEAGVEVAGIDRFRLQAPLAVMDMMAALRFAAQPDDDLNLASLLVSPLIGWSQEDLLTHSVPRNRDHSLWRHLRGKEDAIDLSALREMLERADFITPYQYLEHILSGPLNGRAKLLSRLGEEARDVIDELLQAALDFEQKGHPALQPFIDWFDREQGDIKRENDGAANAVRLLTAHGAKGLQAPVVILADATFNPHEKGKKEPLSWALAADAGQLTFPRPRKPELSGPIEVAQQKQDALDMEEHRRLLYVAMTRAEERLVLTGPLGVRAKGVAHVDSWYALVERAMMEMGVQPEEDSQWRTVIRWMGDTPLLPAPNKPQHDKEQVDLALPDWVSRAAPAEARPPRPRTPTAPGEDDSAQPPPTPAMRDAAERGKLIHALFERLPAISPPDRRYAAEHWLAKANGVADEVVRESLIDHALSIIEAPQYAALFAPEALAEAPIAAVVGEDVIAGTVDRLLVTAERVQIVDFKTGRMVPASVDAVPTPHLRQMAAYVAALEVIFPAHTVEAALLYTSGPVMLALDAAVLEAYKPGYMTAQ